MRTINIPLSKLIKFIPSEPDGGVIPGAVVSADVVSLWKENEYTFRLAYRAFSKLDEECCRCSLDEELEHVPNSNEMIPLYDMLEEALPILNDDGVRFRLQSGSAIAKWNVRNECEIPDPFDAFGPHQLSNFTRCGVGHIASIVFGRTIQLAVVKKDANLFTQSVAFPGNIPIKVATPVQSQLGWLLPWSSKVGGINITVLSEQEMESAIAGAVKF